MRRTIIALLMLLIVPCLPAAQVEDPLFQPFDAAAVDADERRLLQAALALEGFYRGPIDGVWGAASRAAMWRYAAESFGAEPLGLHVAWLAAGLTRQIAAERWRHREVPGLGVSLALPEAVLEPVDPAGAAGRWWSPDGALGVLAFSMDGAGADGWHAGGVAENDAPDALVVERTADSMLTAGVLADGRGFETRSLRVGDAWSTLFVVGEPAEAGRVALIAASLVRGAPQPWRQPAAGRLAALAALAEDFSGITEPAPAGTDLARAADPVPAVAGRTGFSTSGTAFYVGPGALVTAAHVVAECERVTLPGGRPLEIAATDPDLDLALLVAASRSPYWLRLAPEAPPRLGQRVHALGFPYYSITGTVLNLTSGNISALAGLDDDRRFVGLSAPIQPGNSGGPLIDAAGAVVGVVVARLSETYIADLTGTVPQNINYAVRAHELAGFLGGHGAAPAAPGLGGFDLEAGAPPEIERAVVPVLCW
jgi:serine protease Do